ncbi:class II aldolase and adducin N-terminal domain-containing protein [Curvivirga sp.]|uniref:class II aldolase and adducin N-terminal domain-containing protein n=1 Tax=Curvivirga sp. TaxID=2856848 RepID=UPI003B58C692
MDDKIALSPNMENQSCAISFEQERIDLAAALRWAARNNWHEAIANHFSFAVSGDGSQFIMNSYGRHWSKMRASDVLVLDANDEPDTIGDKVDPTAWAIHSAMHRNLPHVRCILHVHSKYATALSCLKDPEMPPIDQNTMRFFNRVAIDFGFDGMGLEGEAERLTTTMGNKSILLMGNHGVMVTGETIAQAYDDLYYFERACETLITALSSGRELNVVSDEIADKTMRQWMEYPNFAEKHFAALKDILDEEEPEYRS